MSRNQLYKNRLELCLSDEQDEKVRKLAYKRKKRLNEIVRMIIDEYKGA
jgi:hypothetical protein